MEEYFMDVYALCFRVLGRPHDAEDAAQETFHALFRGREGLSSAESPRAWVLAVARNTAVSLLRSRRREKPLPGGDVEAPPVAGTVDRERLQGALAGLTEEERLLVQMRFLEGKGPAEMAAACGRSPGAAATALCRALARLRGIYHGGDR